MEDVSEVELHSNVLINQEIENPQEAFGLEGSQSWNGQISEESPQKDPIPVEPHTSKDDEIGSLIFQTTHDSKTRYQATSKGCLRE